MNPMKCPKKGCKNELREPMALNALSRRKSEYICSACGQEEAFEDYFLHMEKVNQGKS